MNITDWKQKELERMRERGEFIIKIDFSKYETLSSFANRRGVKTPHVSRWITNENISKSDLIYVPYIDRVLIKKTAELNFSKNTKHS